MVPALLDKEEDEPEGWSMWAKTLVGTMGIKDASGKSMRHMMQCVVVWTLVTWSCWIDAHAALPVNLQFHQIGKAQGLPQETVTALAQDNDGYLWIGTQTGLARYDGYTFYVYSNEPDNQASLADNYVQSVLVDSKGRLWVGHRLGLDLFDPKTNQFIHYRCAAMGRSGSGDGVTQIISDATQRGLWLASGDGLMHFDPSIQRFQEYHQQSNNQQSVINEHITALTLDNQGGLWVGSHKGVNYLPPSQPRRPAAPRPLMRQVLSSVTTRSMTTDFDGTLWLATETGILHLAMRPDGSVSALPIAKGLARLAHAVVTVVYRDRQGMLWIGSQHQGLFRVYPNRQHIVHDMGQQWLSGHLNDNYVTAALLDRDGTLWVGTWSGGLNLVNISRGGFEQYSHHSVEPFQLSADNVYGISGDRTASLWLAVPRRGIDHVDLHSGNVVNYHHRSDDPHSLASNRTRQAVRDQFGRLWVASEAGLQVSDPTVQRFYTVPLLAPALKELTIYHLLVDAKTLWLSTNRGLVGLDLLTKTPRIYRHDPKRTTSIASNFVVATLRDPNCLWVATFGGGLDCYHPETGVFQHFRHSQDPHSIVSDRVQALYKDRTGRLWIGTASGLSFTQRVQGAFNGALTFTHYTQSAELETESIGAILEDRRGWLWVSSTNGIFNLNPNGSQVFHFTARDGLGDGSYYIGSSYQAADGRMFFGGVDGLTAFYPEQIHTHLTPPQSRITDLKIYNRSIRDVLSDDVTIDGPITHVHRIVLPQRLCMLTVEFSAMHFIDPERNRYAFRLVGFDRHWIQTSASRRFATYTNLDPGHYVFQVRAANKDGVWEAKGDQLDIVIVSPFWATWWFRCLVVGSLCLLGIMAYFYRVTRLKRQAQQLEARVAERTQTLAIALQQLEHASITDPLTGMYNRRYLYRQIESDAAVSLRQHAQGCNDCALLFFLIDVDHFKQLNDTLGHAAGDSLLCQMAPRLQSILRQSDYLVRWGGEEFLVVARHARHELVDRIAERLCEQIRRPFVLDGGHHWSCSCSVGATCFPFYPQSTQQPPWTDAIELADIALYAAKQSGRNGWVTVSPGQNCRTELSMALRNDTHALFAQDVLRFTTGLNCLAVRRVIGRRSQRASYRPIDATCDVRSQ